MYLKGHSPISILETYNTERYGTVKQVIDNDKIISTLISGGKPGKFAERKEHPRDLLDEWFQSGDVIAFTIGLGIEYRGSRSGRFC